MPLKGTVQSNTANDDLAIAHVNSSICNGLLLLFVSSVLGPKWGLQLLSCYGFSWACIASGNVTQAWQNLGQDKTRLAIQFGLCYQSTEGKIILM